MEPVIITTAVTYIALKFLDHFIVEQGYGRIRKALFRKKKYQDELCSIIQQTAFEHEKLYSYDIS